MHQNPILLPVWRLAGEHPFPLACSNPSVVSYWPPYLTLQLLPHWLCFKPPLLVWILSLNVRSSRQSSVVCNNGAVWGSSLRVIINSLPRTSQNAGEIMSSPSSGSVVFPLASVMSYLFHQPLYQVQCFSPLFETRAMRVQLWPSVIKQYTCKLKPNKNGSF